MTASAVERAALVAYRAVSDLVAKGSLFLITIVAAHRLSQEHFGVFALASTFGWIAGVATDFGIQLHVARAVARRPDAAPEILSRWLTVRWYTAGAAAVAIAAGLVVLAPGRDIAVPMLLFALMYLASGMVELLHYFYRGLSRTDLESSLTLAQRVASLGCALVVLAWRPTPSLLAAAMLVPVLVTLVVSLRIATRLGRKARANGATTRKSSAEMPTGSLLAEFWRETFPIGAGIVLSALYFRVDIFLVQRWNGTSAVALYNAVFRLVEALRLFPAAVLAVALPSFFQTRDSRLLRRVSIGLTAFAVVTTMMVWATAEWSIPLLYGERFAAAVPAFRILVLAFPLMSLNYALTHQLIGWDGQRAYAAICGTALVANVAMNAALLPSMSIVGAAWATVWTEVLLTMGCGIALWLNTTRHTPLVEAVEVVP